MVNLGDLIEFVIQIRIAGTISGTVLGVFPAGCGFSARVSRSGELSCWIFICTFLRLRFLSFYAFLILTVFSHGKGFDNVFVRGDLSL